MWTKTEQTIWASYVYLFFTLTLQKPCYKPYPNLILTYSLSFDHELNFILNMFHAEN